MTLSSVCVRHTIIYLSRFYLPGRGRRRFHMGCLLMTPAPVTPPPPAALGHPSAHGVASQQSHAEHGLGSGLGPLLAVDPRLGSGLALGPGLGLLGLGLGSQQAVRGERGERGEVLRSAGGVPPHARM